MASTKPLKVVVQDGRIRLDEATDLPDGTVLEIVPEDPYRHLDHDDELDDEQRAALHAALDKSWAQAQAGERGRPIEEILKDL